MRKEQTMSEQPHDTEPVTIVLATRNQGKVRELAEPLRAFGLRVVGLDAFPDRSMRVTQLRGYSRRRTSTCLSMNVAKLTVA